MTKTKAHVILTSARMWRVTGIVLSVLAPAALAIYATWRGDVILGYFGYFGRIAGNSYRANSVLLLLLLSAQLAVAIGLAFYVIEVFTSIFNAARRGGPASRMGCFSLFSLATVCAVLLLFLVAIVGAAAGYLSNELAVASLDNLVIASRYVTLVTFSVFLFIDGWFMLIARAELKTLRTTADTPDARRLRNDYDLSSGATWFINVPTILVTAAMWALSHRLAENPEFHKFRDLEFYPLHVIEAPLAPGMFELFLNGVEAGVLAAVLLFSQIIFAALRVRWEYRDANSVASAADSGASTANAATSTS